MKRYIILILVMIFMTSCVTAPRGYRRERESAYDVYKKKQLQRDMGRYYRYNNGKRCKS